jgi:hypothetical protein
MLPSTKLALLIVPLAAMLLPAIARADSSQIASIQVGAGTALSSSARDNAGSTDLYAGASLNLSNTSTLFVLPGTQGIDFDYDYSSGHGGHLEAYGLTYSNRISLVPKVAQALTAHVVPYVGFGIGAFEDNVGKKVNGATQSDTKTNFGGKVMAGVNFGGGPFLEASYIISGESEGVRTDSLNLALGLHF